MTRELQDLAWSVLPKEFKEEVKVAYKRLTSTKYLQDSFGRGMKAQLETLFGFDNLTSDAEGEEMLCVSRKRVQEVYKTNLDEIHRGNVSSSDKDCYETVNEVLKTLFGSKCLPDETKDETKEPKPDEPKFKVGDIASYVCSPTLKHKCTVTKVMQNEHSGKYEYNVMFEWGKPGMYLPESDLEPYTEPSNEESAALHAESVKESRIASEESHLRNLSQETANCDKHFDNILKDGFRNERRLHIAVMMMQGLPANPNNNAKLRAIVADALNCADALLSECEKGGQS